jgi:hypothetical protein
MVNDVGGGSTLLLDHFSISLLVVPQTPSFIYLLIATPIPAAVVKKYRVPPLVLVQAAHILI